MNAFLDYFRDPAAVSSYAEGPPRFTRGFADMQKMTAILLAERADAESTILVLGAGGGLELAAFAVLQPHWRFVAVDPSAPMLDQARTLLGDAGTRVQLVEGLIDDAPEGPFAGACCLLTLHFLERAERLRTLVEIRQRLEPGAAFVAAHTSFPQGAGERETWLDRYAAFAVAQGAPPELAAGAREAVAANLPVLDPAADEAVLREAGFTGVTQFYSAFTWRGWVGYA
ncbi:MAG: class I SAM-dependent methyltransferase [Erythrobacter sp.]